MAYLGVARSISEEELPVGVLFLIVFFFVAFLIVGLVLLQEGKGGGLTGMSSGMDGVMGAKNPLRRMTAWLFVFFVLLTISINWYFFSRGNTAIPEGVNLPQPVVMEESVPMSGPTVLPKTEGETALPVPPADAATDTVKNETPVSGVTAPVTTAPDEATPASEAPAASAPEAAAPSEAAPAAETPAKAETTPAATE